MISVSHCVCIRYNPTGGLESDKDYPWDYHNDTCSRHAEATKYTISGWTELPSTDDAIMGAWLVKRGPIAVALNPKMMFDYLGGISYAGSTLCDRSYWGLKHMALLVGYGVEKDLPYWIIKNSWGPDWGEKGYYRIARGSNVCGVERLSTSAVLF